MPGRHRFWFLLATVLVTAAGALAWTLADLPPPGIALRHGWPPSGGATGRTRIVSAGENHIEFVEVQAGYARVHVRGQAGPLARLWEILGAQGDHADLRSNGWVSADRTFWISRDTVRLAARQLPPLPENRLLYLPVWLTAHAEGAFRFATVDQSCLAHAHRALAAKPDSREAARVDSRRLDRWQWIMPGPWTRHDVTRATWRDAFRQVESSTTPRTLPDPDERLRLARLIWVPPR